MGITKWKLAVIYPLALWFGFKLIALLLGFTSYPDISRELFLDDSAPFLPMLFGFWIAAATYFQGDKLSKAINNALIVSFVITGVDVVFLLTLVNNAPTFLAYVSSIYTSRLEVVPSLTNLGLSVGIIGIFVATASTIAAYLLIDAIRRKK